MKQPWKQLRTKPSRAVLLRSVNRLHSSRCCLVFTTFDSNIENYQFRKDAHYFNSWKRTKYKHYFIAMITFITVRCCDSCHI